MLLQPILIAILLPLAGADEPPQTETLPRRMALAVEVQMLHIDAAALKAAKRVEVKVKDGENETTYAGVPLRSLIPNVAKGKAAMGALREQADAVLIVRGSDGYQVALSAVETAMDTEGKGAVLVLEREGKALDAQHGPIQLIVPGDSARVRWVRNVSELQYLRFAHATPPALPADAPARVIPPGQSAPRPTRLVEPAPAAAPPP